MMFKRLFGETKEKQFAYLSKMMIISAALLLISGLVFIVADDDMASIPLIICLYVWAARIVPSMLNQGGTLLYAFSRNIMIGIAVLLLFLIIGIVAGFFGVILGVIRFIQLLIPRIKNKGGNQV